MTDKMTKTKKTNVLDLPSAVYAPCSENLAIHAISHQRQRGDPWKLSVPATLSTTLRHVRCSVKPLIMSRWPHRSSPWL